MTVGSSPISLTYRTTGCLNIVRVCKEIDQITIQSNQIIELVRAALKMDRSTAEKQGVIRRFEQKCTNQLAKLRDEKDYFQTKVCYKIDYYFLNGGSLEKLAYCLKSSPIEREKFIKKMTPLYLEYQGEEELEISSPTEKGYLFFRK